MKRFLTLCTSLAVMSVLLVQPTSPQGAAPYTVINLHPPGIAHSFALGVGGGQQVGYGGDRTNIYYDHALLWSGTADSVVDLNPAGFSSSFTTGTNGQKQVGYGWVSADHRHALVWSGSADSVIDLHQFLPSGYYDSRAHGIDEQGYITQ